MRFPRYTSSAACRTGPFLLDGKFRVLRRAIIPYEVVEPRASYVDSVKAWRFMLRDSIWDIEGVIDVTDKLRAAELLI
jgi:hypothetical protein